MNALQALIKGLDYAKKKVKDNLTLAAEAPEIFAERSLEEVLKQLQDPTTFLLKGMTKIKPPVVINKIYPDFPYSKELDTTYVKRNVINKAEIDDILENGYLLPKTGGKQQKYFTATNEVNPHVPAGNTMIRIERSKVKPTEAVSAKDVEVFNFESNIWEKLLK